MPPTPEALDVIFEERINAAALETSPREKGSAAVLRGAAWPGFPIPQYRSYYTLGRGACWLRPAVPPSRDSLSEWAKLTFKLDFHGNL